MPTKAELFNQYKISFPNASDDKIEEYASKMSEKYSTIKTGDNVIHLDYFDGLLIKEDIETIESSLKQFEIELSRVDKNGVPYASIEEFVLHIALYLKDPLVQSIVLGMGTNALWDTIKLNILFIWKKIKERHWSRSEKQSRRIVNFGLHIKIDKNTSFDLKLDGDLTEELVLETLDKSIDLIKSKKMNTSPQVPEFYVFDKDHKKLTKVDIMKEIHKKIKKQNGR